MNHLMKWGESFELMKACAGRCFARRGIQEAQQIIQHQVWKQSSAFQRLFSKCDFKFNYNLFAYLQHYILFKILPKNLMQIWLVGDGVTAEEQLKAPKGATFIPFSQLPPKIVRKDCFYHCTPSMEAPPSIENVHSCEVHTLHKFALYRMVKRILKPSSSRGIHVDWGEKLKHHLWERGNLSIGDVLKTLGDLKRKRPKRIISTSGESWAVTNGIRARHRVMCQRRGYSPQG